MPNIDDLPLWDIQREAVDTVRRYLAAARTDNAALVQMPTGTGKSGVIAVVATSFENAPHVLVVSPFAALRDQIAKDIRERFWRRLQVDNPPVKPVLTLQPSTASRILARYQDPCVYVCTIQTLQALHTQPAYQAAFADLRQRVSVVLFDEGHREPATAWSDAVQSLGKPTVLLTATPYRNDHKFLPVAREFRYILTHRQALESRYIRQIRFRETRFDRSVEDFVNKLLEFYDGDFLQSLPHGTQARVIVRCESRESVTLVHAALKARNREALAIHDEFDTDTEQERYHSVPSPEENLSTFWVHQNKLIEGIDDPTFRLLAIFERLGNARSLVQQVGRIIRNPGRTANQQGTVFCHPDDGQKEFWEDYQRYEQRPGQLSIADIVASAQAGYQYFEGNYRESISLSDPQVYRHLSYRRSVNAYRLRPTFSIELMKRHLLDDWRKNDRTDVHLISIDQTTAVCVYCSFQNSPVLARHIFMEFQLGYTFFRVLDDMLFYCDSQGLTPEYLRKHTDRISPVKLQRLFPRTATISQVSLMNSDLGRYSVRRRSLNARSLLDTAPSLADQAHVCSTAEGTVDTNEQRLRRYVGFSRARITDKARAVDSFNELIAWTDQLAEELNTTGQQRAHRLFRRFSALADPPNDPIAVNILLDLDDARHQFRTATGDSLSVADTCVDIREGAFEVVANGDHYRIGITYSGDKLEYVLSSDRLEQAYFYRPHEGTRKHDTVVSFLNRQQSFRIVPNSPGYLYSHGHFYTTRLGLTDELDLSRILVPVPALIGKTEKGRPGTAGAHGWSEDSIFGLLDRLGSNTELGTHMRGITHMVCDDLLNENADFIAIDDQQNRVIFIHAKAAGNVGLSASDLAEVCGQATKNLDFLQPHPSEEPGNLGRWDGPWNRQVGVDSVPTRMRVGDLNGREFWNRALTILRNPNASREVWIVFGNGLSKSRFEEERVKQDPAPQMIQAYYQLTATWASVTAVGAKLTVYCCP